MKNCFVKFWQLKKMSAIYCLMTLITLSKANGVKNCAAQFANSIYNSGKHNSSN